MNFSNEINELIEDFSFLILGKISINISLIWEEMFLKWMKRLKLKKIK